MAEVAIPPALPGRWRGVLVDEQEVAGERLIAVTVNSGRGRQPRRHWFADYRLALAHAVQRADDHGLALFDLTTPTGEP